MIDSAALIRSWLIPSVRMRGKLTVGDVPGLKSVASATAAPPSITFILYGIATETSIGRLFIAGIVPGIMLTLLFMAWTLFAVWRKGFHVHAPDFRFSWRQKFEALPKIAPFLAIIAGVMVVLYGGVATPSEAAGVGAALCVTLAIIVYRMWRARDWWQILRDTMRESVMILMIIAGAVLFGYMLTSLYLTQTLATAIADAFGAELLRTDVIRQEIFGTAPHGAATDGGIYSRPSRDRVYEEMLRRAAALHADRIFVVLDGTFSTLDMLQKAQKLAVDPRSVFLAIECVCRPEVARERISQRLAAARDVSDARPELHDIQRMRWEPWPAGVPQVRIDTEQPINKQVEQVIAALALYAPE